MTMLNFLSEPLIRLQMAGGTTTSASLPDVYAALMSDQVDAFSALRPHQRHAWHSFLVQLGAMVMHRDGITEPPRDAAEWYRMIRALTPGYPDDEPWNLVVDDITKPAFMQPPASSQDREGDYKNEVASPDELDMLVTGKNHDVKSSVINRGSVDEWVFSLITRQTMEGYSGAGNHGISRMNGGFGSRPAFGITGSIRPGGHVRRDIIALLEHRQAHPDEYLTIDGGIGLLWTVPWDGAPAEAVLLNQLDPFYIEVCRRIRLRHKPDGGLYAVRTSSRAARVESKALNGITGDPWTPVDMKGNKSLTLAAGGFTYKRVVDYLFPGNWQVAPLSVPTRQEQRSPETMQLVVRAMVRGQGKTEGYHERVIPIRSQAKGVIGRAGASQDLGAIAQQRIERVSTIQRILRHAVATFAAGGNADETSDDHRALANPWANRLDAVVDPIFFDDLQDEFEAAGADRAGIQNDWLLEVIESARGILRDAEDTLPCRSINRYRARARADSVFEGRIRGPQGLAFLYQQEGAGT